MATSPNDDLEAAIDHLVGDDLTAVERHNLLLRLDSTPDGWRRCALAFLEDQAWRAALSEPPASAHGSAGSRTISVARISQRPSGFAGRGALAAAALVACTLAGYGFGVRPQARRPNPDTAAVAAAPAAKTVGQPEAEVVADDALLTEGEVRSADQPGQPLGYVPFPDASDGEALPRQVPVLAITEANQHWLQEQPSVIPEYVRAVWERRGFQVEEDRRLIGLDLQDGRRVAVPIDEVAVNFVGQQPL